MKSSEQLKSASSTRKPVVWLIEDHVDSRRILARVLNRSTELTCPCTFGSCEEALEALGSAAARPDVILLDIGLPGMDGIQGIPRIKAMAPSTHIIILTVFDDQEKVFKSICAGASGYLLKNTDEEGIAKAVREVMEGGSPINSRVARLVLNMFATQATPAKQEYALSIREREVLELMVKGKIKKEIADQLNLSYHTVDHHLRSIYSKLQVHTRGGAVAKALAEGILPR
jgi:DNA-binding NarL/FixJ family response regulator